MTDSLTRDALRAALRTATADLAPRPGLTTDVLRGGARRRTRRRLTIVAGAVAVVAVLGSATAVLTHLPQRHDQVDIATQPTRGDLAKDSTFLDTVVQAWQRDLPHSPFNRTGAYNDTVGRPHVYWAGRTQAGPAALLTQPIRLDGKVINVPGVVGTDVADGTVKVLGVQEIEEPTPAITGFRFGPGDLTVLVLGPGTPVYLSTAAGYDTSGKSVRKWSKLAVADGVALDELPANTGLSAAWLAPSPPTGPDQGGASEPLPASFYLAEPAANADKQPGGLHWGTDVFTVGGAPGRNYPFMSVLRQSGLVDPLTWNDYQSWMVQARLPDGDTAVLEQYQASGEHDARLYVEIFGPDSRPRQVLPGGVLDPNAPLPVRFRLPGGQGWVVAAAPATSIAYRTNTGPWTGSTFNAALLPDNAVQVMVSNPGQPGVVINLS